MNKIYLVAILLCLFLFSFGCKSGKAEFTELIVDHKEITAETVNALVISIEEELELSDLSPEEQANLEDLRIRLLYMRDSAELIEDYQLSLFTDKEIMARLYKLILEKP